VLDLRVAVIGGGAAGFFAAIAVKDNYPLSTVKIFEKSTIPLSKVRISGGGRCNLTNACFSLDELCKAYPRGGKKLKHLFRQFGPKETIEWFESRGVPLVTQEDNCIFPLSQDSQSIISCLLNESKRVVTELFTSTEVTSLKGLPDGTIELELSDPNLHYQIFDKVIVTTGGSPKMRGLEWLERLNHVIERPVPSLFSFNLPGESITKLMGVVAENTILTIQGSKIKSHGALLITHWGVSGPAALKLSSFGARLLNEMCYNFNLSVNWMDDTDCERVTYTVKDLLNSNLNRQISGVKPQNIPSRLWRHLLERCDIDENKRCSEIGLKGVNKIVNALTNDIYRVTGKSAYKEEFVTCGGVSLKSVDMSSLESRCVKNLYFAGEILDIDAITGGYNLQNAWTTGYIAGRHL
jgi:hypothetical protein